MRATFFAAARVVCFLSICTRGLPAQTNMVTQHNDIGRTGQNLTETVLTQANVNSTTFGKLATLTVDGLVYAQPLYMSGVVINGTSHRVVFAATEHDSVFAFDASSGTQLWQASLLDSAHGASLGAVPLPASDSGCTGIASLGGAEEYGVTGTPVIDAASGTLYVVSASFEGTYPVQRLHALDVATGSEKFGGPVALTASSVGAGLGSSNGIITFDPRWELQRPALLEVNGNIYISFAAHCDFSPWHGWILGYDAKTLLQTAAFNLSPNGYGAGLWMGGAGLAADQLGSAARIFPVTGNGTYNATAPYNTGSMDYGDSILNLAISDTGNLKVTDLFTPKNQAELNSYDGDLGAGGALILPDQPGPIPHLLTQIGKSGVLFLANRDALGGYSLTTNNVVQEVTASGLLHGVPAYWNFNLYLWPALGKLSRYPLTNGLLSTVPTETSSEVQSAPINYGLTPSISSNGVNNGIVWTIDWTQLPQVLYAHNANDVSRLLWSSNQNPSRDAAGARVKYVVPTVADGNVFVGSQSQLLEYGLLLAPQNITFPPIPAQSAGTQIILNASSSSGLPVAYSSSTGNCSVSGNIASLFTTGTCTIIASQSGSAAYSAAPAVSQSFTISSAGGGSTLTRILSNVTASGITFTSALVTWSTQQPTTSQVFYQAPGSNGVLTPLDTSLQTSHSVALTNLVANTTYSYYVISANSGTVSAVSPTFNFGTPAIPTAPQVGYVAFWGINNSGVTISWSTDVLATTQVAYGTTPSPTTLTPLQTALAASHGVVLTGLKSGTKYYFIAQSAGANGVTGYSIVYSFTTTGAPASSPPVISNVTATPLSGTSAVITWTTDQASSSQVNYGTTAAYGSSTALDSALVTSHSVTLSGLTPGLTYQFDVTSGGAVSDNHSFITQATTTAPVISAVTAATVGTTTATITWTTDQPATSLVNYGTTAAYGSSSIVDPALVVSHSVTLTGLTPGVTYNFAVFSANSANVASPSTNYMFVTALLPAAPIISNVTASSISATSATITWSTDQPATSQVRYGLTNQYSSSSPFLATLSATHSLTLSGLTPGTTYNYAVVSANSANASVTSMNFTFATPVSTATPPYVGYVAFWGINNSGVTISWSTDVLANTQLAYGTTPALGQVAPVQPALTASHGVVLTGLSSGTTYYFVAQATAANGATGYSTTYSFTTTGTPSVGPPVISNITVGNVGANSALITWNTDQPTTSQVNYGVTTSYGLSSALNSALVTSHTVSLTSLSAGTTYNFAVVSGPSSSTNYTFTTNSLLPPVISKVVATAISNISATITWTTDQPATSQVNYGVTTTYGSVSNLDSTSVTSHSITLTGLTPGTTYAFDVVSAPSVSPNYTFTTTATAAPPAISNVAVLAITKTSATITWTTDQPATSQVNYGITSNYGSASNLDSTLATTHSVTLNGLSPGSSYNLQVLSANAANVSSKSANYTFSTPASSATPPDVSYLVVWGIGNTSATVTWSTDVPATTVLAFGTTDAFGQLSPLQPALANSHGVTLTALTPGTVYYFAAQSTAANGATGYSPTGTFKTTGAAPPTISGISVTPGSNNTVSIRWTTSVPTYSYVQFGPTTDYNHYSTPTSLTTTPQPIVGYVPSGVVHYQLVSTDASGTQVTSPDLQFTEP